MSSWSEHHDAREELEAAFEAMYEKLAYVRGGGLSRRQATHATRVRLTDIFVSTRSDLVIDVEMSDGMPSRTSLRQGNLELGHIRGAGDAEVATPRAQVTREFLRLLSAAVAKLVNGGDVPGLRVAQRPLIAAPVWSDGYRPEIATVDAFSAVGAFPCTVLLGPPGSGKSTLARVLALSHLRPLTRMAGGDTPSKLGLWPAEALVPVFVELRDLVSSEQFPRADGDAGAEDLLHYVHRHVLACDDGAYRYVAGQMMKGEAIIVLDGLDEVPVPHDLPDGMEMRREQITGFIQSVRDRFPLARLLVTSRPAGYSGWSLAGFEVIHLMPLTKDETRSVTLSLYRGMGYAEDWCQQRTDDLLAELPSIPENLRTQPLFVALLAQLFEHPGAELPRQRGALLAEAIDLLLGSWAMPRTGEESLLSLLGCTPDRLLDSLRSIALRALESGDGPEASDREIPRSLILDELYELGHNVNPSGALEYISQHAGILTSPAPRRYRFAHRLFQEYLAASALARRPSPVADLLTLLESSVVTWREVSLLLADVLVNERRTGELWELVSAMLESEETELQVLAAEILTDQGPPVSRSRVYESAVDRVRDRFVELLASEPYSGSERFRIGAALDILGDFRDGVSVVAGRPEFDWIEIPGGRAILGTDSEMRLPLAVFGGEWDYSREEPVARVLMPRFRMARFPVTIAQYQLFVEHAEGFARDQWWVEGGLEWRDANGPAMPTGQPSNSPQTGVTWYEAVAYCRWLGVAHGISARLPTEFEWEWAARGPLGWLYPWSNEPESGLANTLEEGVGHPTPVGVFPVVAGSSPQDLVGNVWEWCSTIVEGPDGHLFRYSDDVLTDPVREELGGADAVKRATRGGYFGTSLAVCRCSLRGRDSPSVRVERQGFRLVQDVE